MRFSTALVVIVPLVSVAVLAVPAPQLKPKGWLKEDLAARQLLQPKRMEPEEWLREDLAARQLSQPKRMEPEEWLREDLAA
ncbi:uncharacterized protein FIBRA_03795 [Fibroporia radiculosa]|uniref:Uncharacterized protein n=1 Tax=Fibroporia radiculosa TaxID=599839 RepID=J4H2L4_9APHY|nr:uncharacterized protein FIBRA_03795 [Fibroporia radiculosa]CCM01729.1 predicted protein [Fibroporia radiculosa]